MAARTKELQALHTAADAAEVKVVSLEKELAKMDEVITRDTATQAAIAAQNVEAENGVKAFERWEGAEAELDKKRRHRKYLGIQLTEAKRQKEKAFDLRRAAEMKAQVDRNEAFFGDPNTDGTFIGELAKVQRGLDDAVNAFRKAIEISEKKIQPSFVGDMPMTGLGLKAGEIIQAIQGHIFRIGSQPFIGGTPGARAPINFPGGKCPDHRLMGMPERVPSLVQAYLEFKKFAVAIQRGERRFDGREPDKEAPTVARPVALAAKSPFIEGLPAASSDDGLAEILGTEPVPAPIKMPVSQGGLFFDPATKSWVQSSVDDGDPYTEEEIEAYQRERLKDAPKGMPGPTPKRRLS